MPENDPIQTETESQLVDYAFWDLPGTSFKVVYSLQLFHEIDFVVNEGYRKIPHGGIEVGGLLFGSINQDSVRIEAFRPIECEHASGPSLNLSERDLTELENQITSPASDAELAKLQPIGWFLAHTRGPLDLTEIEVKQFERFFPEPFRITVLVKPERFQPTRFSFLVRKADREMPRDGTALAVILPLPGRSHKPGQMIASIPAPAPTSSIKRPSAPATETGRRKGAADDLEEYDDEPKVPSEPAAPLSIWKIPPDAEARAAEPSETKEIIPGMPEPAADPRSPAERAARRQLARDRARVMEQGFPIPPPFRPAALPSLPATTALAPGYPASGAAPAGYLPAVYLPAGYVPPGYIAAPEAGTRQSVFNPSSITALALAALLGCLVGYIAYLQLPAPVIALDVRPVNQTIVVSWPPEETRNSMYAAIRFNDGAPVPLSAEEKAAGQVALAAEKDFKVELIARNWVRDSRGIVRYMHSANGNGRVLPSETLPGR